MVGGRRSVERCDILGVHPYSEDAEGLYRPYLGPSYEAAQATLRDWMVEAGMSVARDAAGNLIGRYAGVVADALPLVIGSHLDSVRNAGRYDGPLGIMLGIECVAALHRSGRRMSFPIEVYAFGDEEGSRFPAAMLTSRAVAGTLPLPPPDYVDVGGCTLGAALAATGLSLERYTEARHAGALAYLEAHIEQGPVLEAEGLPVGVVTAIAAQLRYAVTIQGISAHAGTAAMHLRIDALAAAAEMILAAEEVARAGREDLVATVGKLEVTPGAANVVPGLVAMTLDVRAGRDDTRDEAAQRILERWRTIASQRQVRLETSRLQDLPASPCDPVLTDLLAEAVADSAGESRRLVSGAGHDAMIMSALCPTTMLFVRCREGISHNPAEHVEAEDAEVALAVMKRFIDRLEDHVRAAA